MQTKTNGCALCAGFRERERNEELVGVLTAISIVSKRLAGRLAALERSGDAKSEKRRMPYEQNVRT